MVFIPDCSWLQYDPGSLIDKVDNIRDYVVNISSDVNIIRNNTASIMSSLSLLDLSYLATVNETILNLMEQNEKLQAVNMRLMCHLSAEVIKAIYKDGDIPSNDLENDKRDCYRVYKDSDGNYSEDIFQESIDENDEGYIFQVKEDTW